MTNTPLPSVYEPASRNQQRHGQQHGNTLPHSAQSGLAQESPWRYLCALDGTQELDRQLIEATRGEELQILTHMIAGSKTMILYAFSGNGKTSVVSAGIIPFFCQRGYAVFRTRPRPPWETQNPVAAFQECVLREAWMPTQQSGTADALADLKKGVEKCADKDPELQTLLARISARITRMSYSPAMQAADLRAYLASFVRRTSLAEFLSHMQLFLGAETRMLFICDQFEELFVHFYNKPELSQFVSQIGEAYTAENIHAQFVFSMREDWVGSMVEFRRALPDIFSDVYKLLPMTKARAAPILRLPLMSAGYEIDDETVEYILNDLSDQYVVQQRENFAAARLVPAPSDDPYVELPALQIIAEELWNTRHAVDKPFTIEHYTKLPELPLEGGEPKAAAASA